MAVFGTLAPLSNGLDCFLPLLLYHRYIHANEVPQHHSVAAHMLCVQV